MSTAGSSDTRMAPGDRLHRALAMAYLALLPLGPTGQAFAWGALALVAVVRLPALARSYRPIARDRLLWLLAAWAAWHAASILWSPQRLLGLDEMGVFRLIFTPLVLWPVLDRPGWLVGAFLAGVVACNALQLAQLLEWFGLRPGMNDRLVGAQHAIVTGALCAAAMCWHLSAVVCTRSAALRVVSLAGLAAAAWGLAASGSRGPWIAAAAGVPLAVLAPAVRWPAARRPALVMALVGVAGAAAVWFAAHDLVARRVAQTADDLRAARAGDYATDVGLRLARWSAAWAVVRAHPLAGAGAGGYGTAAQRLDVPNPPAAGHHAHSLYLHEAATSGPVGLLLVAAVAGACLLRAAREPPDHPYAGGTLAVTVTWLAGALFDCYQLNGTMFGLLTVVITLTLPRVGGADGEETEARRAWSPGS